MQAYASAEMTTPVELGPLDLRPATTGSASEAVPSGFSFDELLLQLADLGAASVINKLARPDSAVGDDWLDTRCLRVPRHPPRQSPSIGC
jgi:hypothetical protein